MNSHSLKLFQSANLALLLLNKNSSFSTSNNLLSTSRSNAGLVHGIEHKHARADENETSASFKFVPNHRKLSDKEFEAFNEFIRNARRLFVVTGAGKNYIYIYMRGNKHKILYEKIDN